MKVLSDLYDATRIKLKNVYSNFTSDNVEGALDELFNADSTFAEVGHSHPDLLETLFDQIYPIGTIYTNATNPTNPGTLLGFGTWVTWANGRSVVGWYSADVDFDTGEKYGGEKTHVLSVNEMPNHNHGLNNYNAGSGTNLYNTQFSKAYGGNAYTNGAGGGLAHNNMHPYMVGYIWKRTA